MSRKKNSFYDNVSLDRESNSLNVSKTSDEYIKEEDAVKKEKDDKYPHPTMAKIKKNDQELIEETRGNRYEFFYQKTTNNIAATTYSVHSVIIQTNNGAQEKKEGKEGCCCILS